VITREQAETQIDEDEIFRQARQRVEEKTSTFLINTLLRYVMSKAIFDISVKFFLSAPNVVI